MIRHIGLALLLTTVAAAAWAQPPASPPGRGVVAAAAGPPAPPAEATVTRRLQGSVSAVFDPGAKTARLKLIETDDHGVEGVRMLKAGDLYREGWRIGAVTGAEATLRKGKTLLHVDLTRGWPAQSTPVEPAVLTPPAPPANPLNGGRAGVGGQGPGQAGRRGPGTATVARGAAPAANGLGLSNARVGGSPPAPPPAPIPSTFQGPNGPITILANPDGTRTVTSTINGRNVTVTLPVGQ